VSGDFEVEDLYVYQLLAEDSYDLVFLVSVAIALNFDRVTLRKRQHLPEEVPAPFQLDPLAVHTAYPCAGFYVYLPQVEMVVVG
jgi:hypothetical protein